jgi:hypothetical protein
MHDLIMKIEALFNYLEKANKKFPLNEWNINTLEKVPFNARYP